jgi:hypothetical protein
LSAEKASRTTKNHEDRSFLAFSVAAFPFFGQQPFELDPHFPW